MGRKDERRAARVAKWSRKHGYAAFAPADTADAKRRAPDVDLSGYAARRGLEHRGQDRLDELHAVMPEWAEYAFNCMSGALPDGSYGALLHEKLEVPVTNGDISWSGSYYHVVTRGPSKGALGCISIVLPIDLSRSPRHEPFGRSGVWIPTTKVALRLPEAALLPAMTVKRKAHLGLTGTKLDDDGAPGFRLIGQPVPEQMRRELFGGGLGHLLGRLSHPYVELQVQRGAMSLQRNGYARTDDELDDLVRAACAMAEHLRAVCGPLHAPGAFADPLPPPRTEVDWAPWYPLVVYPFHEVFPKAAAERGMVLEDLVEYHRRFPRVPVPGTALGVMRGRLPGTAVLGRLVFHQQGNGTGDAVRGGVLFEAPPHPPPFRLGGTFVEETQMYVEVVDGIAAIWNAERTVAGLHSARLAEGAVSTARRVGLL